MNKTFHEYRNVTKFFGTKLREVYDMKKDLAYGASYTNDVNTNRLIMKRNGECVHFDSDKIKNAIQKANNKMTRQWNKITLTEIENIVTFITQVYDRAYNQYLRNKKKYSIPTVEFIQDEIEAELVRRNLYALAKEYMTYRYQRALARKRNTTDESILKLIKNENKELAEENSNKNTMLASTQRDYIAGEVSRDITARMLLPDDVIKAHEEGILHFHDMDYFIQPIFNCCLINIKDMLDNGTVMNNKMVESPKSFQVACTVMTQIIAAVASNQYGGQSVNIKHLGKYLARSREKFRKELEPIFGSDKEKLDEVVNIRLMDELKAGVQTIQYQINTLMTTNGQSPFVTIFLHLDPNDEYIDETALIIEEILKQRTEGIKNEKGIYVTPEFPKLIYVLDEWNCLEGGKYDYITELAVACSIKRMYPDYISAKKMRENYENNVFSCMGCVDGRSVIDYKIGNVRYVEAFDRAWNRLSKIYIQKYQPNGHDKYMNTKDVSIWDTVAKKYVKQSRIIQNTQNEWVDIKFSNGRMASVTGDHPFEVIGKGVVLANDIVKGDQICRDVKKENVLDSHTGMIDDIMWAKGYIHNSRWYSLGDQTFVEIREKEVAYRLHHILKTKMGYDMPPVKYETYDDKSYYKVTINGSNNLRMMCINEFEGLDTGHIPQYIFNSATTDEKLDFFAGIIEGTGLTFDINGYFNTKTGSIKLYTYSFEGAMQRVYLAMDLGFEANMYEKTYIDYNTGRTIIGYCAEIFDCSDSLMQHITSNKKKALFEKYAKSKDKKTTKEPATTCTVINIEKYTKEKYSYDVTTESDHFSVNGFYSHNCRSFLSTWKNENGEYQFEGRFNQGVVSLNLPQIAILSEKSEKTFWSLLDERLELCFKALMCRHKALEGTPSDISPIHWQYGAIARLEKGEPIDKLLHGGYSTISLGYIGIYETVKLMKGVSHTNAEGTEFALRVMNRLREATDTWKKETGIAFGLYGTPAESLCYRFARIDKEKFGDIPDVTDKGYYTNSYHVDVREHIDAFNKLKFESQFQTISSGGSISYIEVPCMAHNPEAMKTMVNYMYHNIQYSEFNTKSDYCHKCGFDGEILLNDNNEWECPNCGNKDKKHLTVTRRTCGLNPR